MLLGVYGGLNALCFENVVTRLLFACFIVVCSSAKCHTSKLERPFCDLQSNKFMSAKENIHVSYPQTNQTLVFMIRSTQTLSRIPG